MTNNDSDFSGLSNLLSKMQDLSKAIYANLQIPEVTSSLYNIQQQMIDSIQPIMQSQIQSSKIFSNLLKDFEKSTPLFFIDLNKQIENLFSPILRDFRETFQVLPSQTQDALLTLGNHGWFFDLEMPLPSLWELEHALKEGNIEEAEVALVDYFRDNLLAIENNLNMKFPHRAKVISLAFKAHKHGEYELSIPVFLAQTDGICYEVINQHLFMRKNKKPSTAIYVDTVTSNAFRHALLSPLSEPLPISASEYERGESFNALNRHQVMHGEVLDYGTEINSLKLISLLNYVSQVLKLDDQNKD